jgi:hypothetical protein
VHHHPWTDDRISRALEAWFADRAFDEWPTYQTFVRDGHKRLHAQLMRAGGPQRWAVELGVPLRDHRPGGALRDDEILPALHALLREHRPDRFPASAWLTRHGPRGLAAAVKRTGGATRWARTLNMPPPQVRWTDDRIEAELRRLFGQSTRWPSRAEFRAAHATGLLRAVYTGRGSRWWAKRLGLSTEHLRARRSDIRHENNAPP